jgi:hypothetical protein
MFRPEADISGNTSAETVPILGFSRTWGAGKNWHTG